MVEIINFKRKRKEKARQDRETAAAANRVKFGRSKDEKKLAEAQARIGGAPARCA